MKDKMKKFFTRLPREVLLFFGVVMIVFTTVACINGFEAVSVCRIFQLLGIAVIAGALMLIAFSDIFIKKMNQILRAVIFIIPLMLTTLIAALTFSWFPAGSLKAWAIFFTICLGCFTGCFVIFLIIHFIESMVRGKKYTEKLKEYQSKNNKEI
ncbi:MAG: hypothetical protein IJ298_02800 [Ruminococcus sp.]|nr:hypothetical protein [Ruminococcus sp.]